jgi:CheY-like chemotaxis protein
MIVRCPQCGTQFRLVAVGRAEKVVRYLCPGCHDIVQIDLQMDEVRSTSSSVSYGRLERQKTVVVADDSPKMLELAGLLLGEAGFKVLRAADGLEALEIIQERHPDLVVLDLLMPRMNGFEVLKKMQQDERIRDTPVVVISGLYKDDILKELNALGADDFVPKDSMRRKLVARARRLVSPDATP